MTDFNHSTESRSLQLSKTDMADINEALAWTLTKLDTEFKDGEGIRIEIAQIHHDCDVHDQEINWNAIVTGFFNAPIEEPAP